MRGHDNLENGLFAARECTLQIALEQRGERLLALPLRVLGCKGLHAIQSECQLKIHRLLRPEGAVVIEGRDALGGRYEIGGACRCHLFHEFDYGLLGFAIVPGRKRIRGLGDGQSAADGPEGESQNAE